MGAEVRRPAESAACQPFGRLRSSMPGVMETVLNVGLCSATIPGLIKKSGNERFVYDACRRLITMHSGDYDHGKGRGRRTRRGQGCRCSLGT